jgi:hypothetical protein
MTSETPAVPSSARRRVGSRSARLVVPMSCGVAGSAAISRSRLSKRPAVRKPAVEASSSNCSCVTSPVKAERASRCMRPITSST